jgi:pyridoxine 5-phosphate synthase
MKLSVNLNKIALLRNARGENYPDLNYFANKAIDLGVDGLTLHPRPDHRHATSTDVINLAKLSKERHVEFNIEGNPFSKPNGDFLGFIELVEIIKPNQVTLVPDEVNQITSDHGWSEGNHDDELIDAIAQIRNSSKDSKISLFIDDMEGVAYANRLNVELIEIHTGKFAKNISDGNELIVEEVENIVKAAQDMGILVNAGHDLNLENLKYLVMMDNINEVSIGHAIIVDSLFYGYEDTLKKYLKIIRS